MTTFTALDLAKPTTAQTRQAAVDSIRTNIFAIAAFMLATGCTLPPWTYTNSVTRALGSPGTASQPNIVFFTRGSGGTTEWIKCVLTWNGTTGNVDKVAYYYSSDNEATYANMGDGTNYVQHFTYDGSGNLTATTWDAVP
jgi:hypothetical protein